MQYHYQAFPQPATGECPKYSMEFRATAALTLSNWHVRRTVPVWKAVRPDPQTCLHPTSHPLC